MVTMRERDRRGNVGALLAFGLMLATAAASWAGGSSEAPGSQDGPVPVTIFSTAVIPEGDRIIPTIEAATNTSITLEGGGSADYATQLGVRIAGGTIPDVFYLPDETMGSSVLTTLTTYARDGVLLALDDYLPSMPNYTSVIPEASWYNVTVDGKIYALPKQPQNNMTAQWVRKDWLDKLGLGMPKSFDEYLALAKAFLNADLDGNGIPDTYSVGGRYGLENFGTFFTGYGVAGPGQVMIRDNKAVYASTLPEFREAIGQIRRFVAAGVVDPEIMTPGVGYVEKMATGNLAMVYGRWADQKKWENLEMFKAIDPNMDWAIVPPFQGPHGETGVLYDGAGYVRLYGVNADLKDDPRTLEGVLRIWDYVSSPEGNRLVMYGFEGENYNMEDGAVVPTDKIADVAYSASLQFTGRDNMSYLLTKFGYIRDDVLFCANDIPLMNYYNTLVVPPTSVNLADIKTYENEQLLAFIYGKRPMSEYDDFLNTLYKVYDLQDYVDAAQATLKGMGYIR